MNQNDPIPSEAQRAADQGNLIAAIDILREQAGLDLKEAKDAIEAYLHGRLVTSSNGGAIPLKAILSLQEGNLIDAIRETRDARGRGLKESKEAVEAYLSTHPDVSEQYRAKRRSGSWWHLPLLLAIAIVLVVFFMR